MDVIEYNRGLVGYESNLSIYTILIGSVVGVVAGLVNVYVGLTLVPIIDSDLDKFSMKIYPTASGGREWSIKMDDPSSDGIFDPASLISWQPDGGGSWQVSGIEAAEVEQNASSLQSPGHKVRMNVKTPEWGAEWQNVEITGYAKVVNSTSERNGLAWFARGGEHTSSKPCEGTALYGQLFVDGRVAWEKEIWHTGGYAEPRAEGNVTDSILGRWIGWKVIMYNMNETAVKMESYFDNANNNTWIKATELIDNGGWFATSSDEIFYGAHCDRPKDYVITNSGSNVTFRSDGIVWNFRNLSVREIQTPIDDP